MKEMPFDELPNQYGHGQCLLCGHKNPLSLKLVFQSEDNGDVIAYVQGRRLLQGYAQFLHGGVLASLLDAAMTHCLFHQGVEAVTADLHVRYVHSVPYDAELKVKASFLSCRGPIYKMRGEIYVQDQRVVWAEAKFMPRKKG